MSVHYSDEHVTLHHGRALAVLPELPAGSVNCVVTSPPYFGLRDYGHPDQDGLEPTPQEYVANLVAVMAEVRRVLADDGTVWLNLGDSYASDSKWGGSTGGKHVKALHGDTSVGRGKRTTGLPDKNLIGVPWRVALALQDDGWILRNDIIWAKPNAMPESITDRLSTKHEHLFLLTKSRRYWFDLDPIREPVIYPAGAPQLNWARDSKEADVPGQSMRQHRSGREHGKASSANLAPTGSRHVRPDMNGGRNPGDVWTIPTQPFGGAHFAVMPVTLAERCIQAGCKSGGTVLDPYSGSGTTGLAAARHGRRYVGIDVNADYLDLSLRTRLAQTALIDEEIA